MSKKKTAIPPKPGSATSPANADDWVSKRAVPEGKEPTRRMTFDLVVSIHTRMKVACAQRGIDMADALRELIEKNFP